MKLFLIALFLFAGLGAYAQTFTPYGHRMVLQKSDSTSIAGVAKPHRRVEVVLAQGQQLLVKAYATADEQGRFQAYLPLKEYGTGYTLYVGDSTYHEVAVGEVWMLSGQSNMSWPLGASAERETVPQDRMVRMIVVRPTFVELRDSMTAEQLDDLNALRYAANDGWQYAEGDPLQQLSGIGAFFAARLRQTMPDVPIGLIQTAFGGTTAETFAPRSVLASDPLLAQALTDWRHCSQINEWCRSLGVANLKGATSPNQRHYFEPTFFYDARIAPLASYTFRGVLWYQGESNAENIAFHDRLFPRLVASWRKAFRAPHLPFYFVQLSSHNRDSWPAFRDAQRRLALEIDNCEMVVSSDHGNPADVHPTAKKPIGERLAAVALARDYGFNLPYLSPAPLKLDGNTLSFTNLYGGLKTADRQEIRGFETSTDGVQFAPTSATIQGNTIRLNTTQKIRIVRYAWRPSTDANLVNSAGLPLSTFQITQTKPE